MTLSPKLRGVVRNTGLHHVVNWGLKRLPLTRRFGSTRYRTTRVESFELSRQIFGKKGLYDIGTLPNDFTTFVDLGCNVGYFSCLLFELAKGRPLSGLLVDANPELIDDARQNVALNGQANVHAIHGIVGEAGSAFTDFYIYDSSVCSTRHQPDLKAMSLEGHWSRIWVPTLDLEQEWTKRFGDIRCHVAKIDIEGSELNLLKTDAAFLRRCDTVLMEWHKWCVTFVDLVTGMRKLGFEFVTVTEEDPVMGIALFRMKT